MEANVYLFGDIGYDEKLQPNGISDVAFISECEKAKRNGATSLNVFIDTDGGLVSQGENIASYLRSSQIPVTTIVENKAYSIGSKIFLAGGKRKMKSYAKVMIHNNWADGIKGDADQVQAAADQLAATEKKLRKEYAALTGLSEEVIDGLMKSETYIDANTAINLGLAHEIMNEEKILAKYKNNTMAKKISNKILECAKSFLVEKNMVVNLKDGKQVFVESEDGDFIGKSVYVMDNGNMTETPAPDGEHALEDGRVLVVSGGVVTEVKEAQSAQAKTDTAKIETLEAALKAEQEKNEALQKQFNELNESLKATQSNYEQVNKQLVQLAKTIKSEYVAPNETPQFGRRIEHKEEKGSFDKNQMRERREKYKK